MGLSESDAPRTTALTRSPPPPRGRPFLGRSTVPLPTGKEAAAFDAWAIQERGVPDPVLMENAGRSAAALLQALAPTVELSSPGGGSASPGPVVVLAGPGNNGGDGVVLARTLASWGREVHLVVVGDRPDPDPLLHDWSLRWLKRFGQGLGLPELETQLARASVVVDGLLGTGITGAPRDPFAQVIQAVNRSGTPVLALDLPSGVDADTGALPGPAIQARWTVAFGGPKRGTLLHPGRARAGRLLAVEIGFPPLRFGAGEGQSSGRLLTPGWAAGVMPRRDLVTHKNVAGRLLLVAGQPGMAGAAILAARAALRSGVGYLRVATPLGLRELVQSAVPGAIHLDAQDQGALAEGVAASDALAVGPGMGTDAQARHRMETVLELWGEERARRWQGEEAAGRAALPTLPLILDADALNLLALDEDGTLHARLQSGQAPVQSGQTQPRSIEERSGEVPDLLLTPHPGEARRLVPLEDIPGAAGEGADPGLWARALARNTGGAVLLKGNPSVVATANPQEPVLYSATASSHLARAGMGDVLTGCIGGLAAQGVPPVTAGGLALHLTGRAAMLSPKQGGGPLPDDVVDTLPDALAEASGEERRGHSPLAHPFLLLDLPAPW